MFGRIQRRRVRNWLIGVFGPLIVRLWVRSLRIRFVAEEAMIENGLPMVGKNGIFTFWHQRLLVFGGYFRNSGFRALVSRHQDGEMIARVVEGLGMRAIRGSTRRGGSQALREILAEDLSTLRLAVTPDGPRGPCHVFQAGSVYVASRSGLPVYPATVALSRSWSLPTWDGFLLPVPFSRALMRVGEPIRVPDNLPRNEVETWRQRIETTLRELTDTTDADFETFYASGFTLADLRRQSNEPGAEPCKGPDG